MRLKLLFVLGTRPEAIKLAPLIKIFSEHKENYEVKVCNTGQHKELIEPVLDFFGIIPDYNLNIMKPNQSLSELNSDILKNLDDILLSYCPHTVFVQGDTTTAFVAALSAFYFKIDVVHIEAGLRSNSRYAPFPEEMNRVLISRLAKYHFAPTEVSRTNLESEGINENVFTVGNTGIDALKMGIKILHSDNKKKYFSDFENIDFSKKIILVTLHRREIFGSTFESILKALRRIVMTYPEVELVYPVHKNPNIREMAYKILGDTPRIHLTEPLGYPQLIWLMNHSVFVMTDSGGIQEEAPSIGKLVLVLRDKTERPEGISNGVARLVGTDENKIFQEVSQLLDKGEVDYLGIKESNVYGDGKSSKRILDIFNEQILPYYGCT